MGRKVSGGFLAVYKSMINKSLRFSTEALNWACPATCPAKQEARGAGERWVPRYFLRASTGHSVLPKRSLGKIGAGEGLGSCGHLASLGRTPGLQVMRRVRTVCKALFVTW